MRALFLVAFLCTSTACAQDTERPPSRPVVDACSIPDDIGCAARDLEHNEAIELAGSLFVRHAEGEIDIERLIQLRQSELIELSPPLLLGGTLLAIQDVAPDLVESHGADRPPPQTAGERAAYIRTLLDAFAAADIDLSDREITEPAQDDIHVIEIDPDR